MSDKHIGSDFDEFLKEEGLFTEAEALAVKRVIAFQIEQMMAEKKLTKTALAKLMHTSRSAVNRLLDPSNPSVTLQTLEGAARALGKRLTVTMA